MAVKVGVVLLALVMLVKPGIAEEEVTKPGSLVMVGGGQLPDGVREKFMTLAGGKAARLVIVPTASFSADLREEDDNYLRPWRRYAPASINLLHTRSHEKANDPAFFKPIIEATAVWLGGGDQVELVAAYRGTAVEREFKALLKRGGVIGGTSAGAAVMSDVMIEGGNPNAVVGRGFGFIRNAVVDQHFLKRSRVNRLLGVLSDRPDLIGIGIDEETAFLLRGEEWHVIGRSYVIACQVDKGGIGCRVEAFADGDRGVFHRAGLPTIAMPPKQ
jgi:cyanophycinase